MTVEDWTPVAAFVIVAFALSALARAGLRGGELRRTQTLPLWCPTSGDLVSCHIVQDVRTGQWGEVVSCSRFGAAAVTCGQECAGLLNLGLPPDARDGTTGPPRRARGA